MQSWARTCLARRTPCTGRLSRSNNPFVVGSDLLIRLRFFRLVASSQVPTTAIDNCHDYSHLAQTLVHTRTKPPAETPPGLASSNHSIPPPAPSGRYVRSSTRSSRSTAAERARLQGIVQQRIDRLPHAQQVTRQHNKQAARRPPDAYTRHPRTRSQTHGQIDSRQPSTGHPVQSPGEEWQSFIHRLSSLPRTRRPRDSNGRSVELTTAFVQHYTGTTRPNSWIQDVGSRAVVELLPPSSPDVYIRQAILHGSDRAVELAKLDLIKLQADFESPSHTASSTHPTDITFDTINSISTFTRFVLQTTNRYVPPALQRDTGRPSLDSVSDALMAVFEHPAISRFASTVSLNHALRFFCCRNFAGAAHTAHSLYLAAKSLNLVPGISTFNILLESAIRTNNAKRASFLLREMHRENVSPNSHTWTLLFSLPCLEDKTALLRLIMESGIPMSRQGFAIITRAVITDLLPNQRPSCDDLRRLFADLDHIFGLDWLTVDSYHHLLALCSFRPREGVVTLLNELPSQRSLKLVPNSAAYLQLLNRKSAISRDRISDFVTALQGPMKARQHLVVPRFFLAAWHRCFYNLCAVIWRFAATRGLITQQMQHTVNMYLVRGTAHPTSRTASRKGIGARIVAGVQWQKGARQVAVLSDVFPKLAKRFADNNRDDARIWLTGFTADDGTRDEQMSLFFLTLHEDLNAWKRFRPMSYGSLQHMLDKAYEIDQRWIGEGKLDQAAKSEDAVLHVLDQAISVPLAKLKAGETNWVLQKKVNQRDRVMDAAKLKCRHGHTDISTAVPAEILAH